MTDLRQAAQQALEAMRCMRGMVAHPDNLQFIDKHITALDAALAQEPAPMPSFPPVSQWKRGCVMCGIGADGKAYGYVCSRNDCPTKVTCGGVV